MDCGEGQDEEEAHAGNSQYARLRRTSFRMVGRLKEGIDVGPDPRNSSNDEKYSPEERPTVPVSP